ncbi:MAG: CDP-alcohol phosphatidyltransferase family protein, partial [Burkholderiales bacterium]
EGVASVAWPAVAVATLAAVLDAVDGPLARGTGLASPFGARFDMETDALLLLVLALLAWQLGKAGGWIVAAGLLRYVFVGAGRAWRWLERPLPASTRRKAICVIQIVTLIVALAPIVSVAASTAIAGAGLVLLVYSFAVDVAWLRRRAGDPLMETAS